MNYGIRKTPDTANDFLYAWESSTDFDPSAQRPQIGARVLTINVEDDERNPPELGIMEREIARVPRGRYMLIPTSADTYKRQDARSQDLLRYMCPNALTAPWSSTIVQSRWGFGSGT